MKKERKKEKKNKHTLLKILIPIILILGLIVIIYSLFFEKKLTRINYNQFFDKWNNKESFVLVISKTTCSACKSYLPKVKKIVKNNKINIYYIEADTLTSDENKSLNDFIDYNKTTPTTVFITNGEETSKANRLIGNTTEENIIEKLKANNFIK